MNVALAQRQIALAGIALLAGILALGLSSQKHSSSPKLPESIPAPGGGWYQAIGTSNGPTFRTEHQDSDCGYTVGPDTRIGVANPVLPCDTRIYIQFEQTETLTQVIARWAYEHGHTGLAYPSRFDETLTLWAIFEGAAFVTVGVPEPIEPDDADLAATAQLFGLTRE